MRPEALIFMPARVRRFYTILTFAATAFVFIALAGLVSAAEPQKIAADAAHDAALAGEIILVDIRTPEEWQETGIADGAVAYDMQDKGFVQALVDLRTAYPEKPIALICRTGNRSGYASKALTAQGFPGLMDVSEGMAGGPNGTGWLGRGLPVYAGTPVEIAQHRKAVLP